MSTESQRGPAGSWEWFCYWSGGRLDTDRTLAGMPVTDLDAAKLISGERPDQLSYLVGTDTWHIWNGRCHQPDTSNRVSGLILEWAERYRWAVDQCFQQERSELVRGGTAEAQAEKLAREKCAAPAKYAASVAGNAGSDKLKAMLAKLRGQDASYLDERHPGWLNFADCTVHLDEDRVHPHDPADMLAYALPWAWDGQPWPQQRCPGFMSLLGSVSGGDPAVAEFLLKVLGYSLLGDNREQVVIFINGPTKSGKSQILYVVRTLLAALAHESKAELVTLVRHGRNARTEFSIRGKRLVTITETSGFMHIDEGQLKRITGEPVISVDKHYASAELKTPVTWLIVVATNNMPSITSFDGAMQERVVVVPGGPTVPAHLRDKGLAERIIREEAAAVLALLVKACRQYVRDGGLVLPPAVQMETERYRQEQNTVANFLADACETFAGPGTEIPMPELWEGYQRWAGGAIHLSRNDFRDQMASQPGVGWIDNGGSKRVYTGIRWNTTWRNRVWTV